MSATHSIARGPSCSEFHGHVLDCKMIATPLSIQCFCSQFTPASTPEKVAIALRQTRFSLRPLLDVRQFSLQGKCDIRYFQSADLFPTLLDPKSGKFFAQVAPRAQDQHVQIPTSPQNSKLGRSRRRRAFICEQQYHVMPTTCMQRLLPAIRERYNESAYELRLPTSSN